MIMNKVLQSFLVNILMGALITLEFWGLKTFDEVALAYISIYEREMLSQCYEKIVTLIGALSWNSSKFLLLMLLLYKIKFTFKILELLSKRICHMKLKYEINFFASLNIWKSNLLSGIVWFYYKLAVSPLCRVWMSLV